MKRKTKTEKVDRWRPIRKGSIYCSPACGGNCTYAKFMEATQEADRVAKSLGKGWTAEVHENLGWHYNVVSPCKRIRVHGPYGMLRKEGEVSVFLCDKGDVGGRYAATGKTAKSAIRNVIAIAKADLAKIGAVLQGF